VSKNQYIDRIVKKTIFIVLTSCVLFSCGSKAEQKKADAVADFAREETVVSENVQKVEEKKADAKVTDLATFDLRGDVKKVDLFKNGEDMYEGRAFTADKKLDCFNGLELKGGDHHKSSFKEGGMEIEVSLDIVRNAKGQITSMNVRGIDGLIKREYTYDESGRVEEYLYSAEGDTYVTSYTYDGQGNCIKAKEVFDMGDGNKVEKIYTYTNIETDSHGNWTRRSVESQGDGSFEETRKIEYYK